MMLFDYWCPNHGEFEAWGNAGQEALCPTCQARAKPMPGKPGIKLEGTSGHFPRAARMWADRHERHEEPGREI